MRFTRTDTYLQIVEVPSHDAAMARLCHAPTFRNLGILREQGV
jgi:hypothetical protein